jgi:multicomponent Na+:H+ antiporter subunit G
LCAAFVLLTSPVAAHALAKGAHMSGVKLWEKSVVDKYDEEVDHEAHSHSRGE